MGGRKWNQVVVRSDVGRVRERDVHVVHQKWRVDNSGI